MATNSTMALDGYVVGVLMRDLVGHDRSPSAFIVYLAIHAAAAEGRALFSYQAMAELTGLSKRTCQNAVVHLDRRGLVEISREGRTDAAEYRPLRPWRRDSALASGAQRAP
jgi:hypothetical protein